VKSNNKYPNGFAVACKYESIKYWLLLGANCRAKKLIFDLSLVFLNKNKYCVLSVIVRVNLAGVKRLCNINIIDIFE